jgi:hypothetical protein
MSAIRSSSRYPCDLLQTRRSLSQWKPWGHSLYLKVVRRNATSAAPRSRCTSRFMRWRATHFFCSGVLNFPVIHAPGSRVERPQTRTTADVANVADVRAVLTRFSDKLVRGLRQPEPNQNRMPHRSPKIERPPPNDIAANSPNLSPHPHVPCPGCRDCPRDWGR